MNHLFQPYVSRNANILHTRFAANLTTEIRLTVLPLIGDPLTLMAAVASVEIRGTGWKIPKARMIT